MHFCFRASIWFAWKSCLCVCFASLIPTFMHGAFCLGSLSDFSHRFVRFNREKSAVVFAKYILNREKKGKVRWQQNWKRWHPLMPSWGFWPPRKFPTTTSSLSTMPCFWIDFLIFFRVCMGKISEKRYAFLCSSIDLVFFFFLIINLILLMFESFHWMILLFLNPCDAKVVRQCLFP